MIPEELFILLLCMVPFIENRGAMFVGFAMGITNPLVYLAGTLLNILTIPIYFAAFSKFRILRNFNIGKFFQVKGPISFVLLIPGTANGANAFTTSLIAANLSLDFMSSFFFISIGVILRGLMTFAILSGSLSLANAANIGDTLSVILFITTLFFLFPRIKNFIEDQKTIIRTPYLFSGLFAALAILSLLFPSISIFFRDLLGPVVSGSSDAKVLSFFAFASLFCFCSGYLKPYPKAIRIFFASTIAIFILGILAFVMTYPIDHLPLFPSGNAYSVNSDHFSYNKLTHYHALKPAMIFPLVLLGINLDESVYDYGLVFLNRVPGILYAVFFLLFMVAIISAIFTSSSFRKPSAKAAALLGMFIFLKLSVNGGFVNPEFFLGAMLLVYSLKERSSDQIFDFSFWSLSLLILILISMILAAAPFFPSFSEESYGIIAHTVSLTALRFFAILLMLVFLKSIERNGLHKSNKIFLLLPLVSLLVSFYYSSIHAYYFDVPLNAGDTMFIITDKFVSDYSFMQPINHFSVFLITAEKPYDSLWNRIQFDERDRLKANIRIWDPACVSANLSFHKRYLVYGYAREDHLNSEYFNLSLVSISENLHMIETSAHPCFPQADLPAIDFLSKNCDDCVIVYDANIAHQFGEEN